MAASFPHRIGRAVAGPKASRQTAMADSRRPRSVRLACRHVTSRQHLTRTHSPPSQHDLITSSDPSRGSHHGVDAEVDLPLSLTVSRKLSQPRGLITAWLLY